MTMPRVDFICNIAHLVWCGYQRAAGQPFSEEPSDEQKQSILAGVNYYLQYPNTSPEESHAKWIEIKEANGWVYGPEKDEVAKTHPDLRPFNELSEIERKKDDNFQFACRKAVELYDQMTHIDVSDGDKVYIYNFPEGTPPEIHKGLEKWAKKNRKHLISLQAPATLKELDDEVLATILLQRGYQISGFSVIDEEAEQR